MNNASVQQGLVACDAELSQVHSIIVGLGVTSNITPFLTNYAVIRACGAIEIAFKAVIADYCEYRSKIQVKRFIDIRVRDSSTNPSYSNILRFLTDFDPEWKKTFVKKLDAEPNRSNLLTSLQSLVDARNGFAHGGSPSASISDVLTYFSHAKRIIEIMDEVVG